ncbi:hypothetical protein [Sinomicrobium sp. M5D2P9]
MSYKQKLPPLIRTTLEERIAYHKRFMLTCIIAADALFLGLVLVIRSLRNEAVGIQFFLVMIWFIFLAIPGYFIFYHRKRRRLLDDRIKLGRVSVVSGTLDGTRRLGGKRVRYTIDGHYINGTLVFPGFTAFQNTWVVDVITIADQPVELYLLPGELNKVQNDLSTGDRDFLAHM